MFKVFTIIFIILALFGDLPKAHAQEILAGASAGNLSVREGNVTIKKETLDVKLHLGFAEIKQNLSVQNGAETQKVVLGLPYRVGASELSANNFRVSVNGLTPELNTTKESDGQEFIYWKIFEFELLPNQNADIEFSHWQLNGANLRGLRTFEYSLKNKFQTQIKELSLRLSLMDGVSLKNFDRTVNPDLDLKLEPLGWKTQESDLVWEWNDLVPSFNINANFYWPGGDLAKTADLSQSLGLYQVKASSNPDGANQLHDSSYLTAWKEEASGPGIGETLNLTFPSRTIREIRIIPGLASSTQNFQNYNRPKELILEFDGGPAQTVTLDDQMSMQNLSLTQAVTASNLKITLNSVYAGQLFPDETYISEIELGASPANPDLNQKPTENRQTVWQRFFVKPLAKAWVWTKNIF